MQLISQGKWVDEEPELRRSPSPEPLYNEQGARTNTREQRAKEKLLKQRNVSGPAGGGITQAAQLLCSWTAKAAFGKLRKQKQHMQEHKRFEQLCALVLPRVASPCAAWRPTSSALVSAHVVCYLPDWPGLVNAHCTFHRT